MWHACPGMLMADTSACLTLEARQQLIGSQMQPAANGGYQAVVVSLESKIEL